jgi:predicted secreted Zn-dependent protease
MTMYQSAPGDLNWRASSTCDGGACVMVARHGDSVMFGNTSQPGGPVYVYTEAEWKEFLAGVKLGDFDDLA